MVAGDNRPTWPADFTSSTTEITITISDDSSSDSRTPMKAPSTPTVMPLPARRPSMAVLKRPTTVPRMAGGARICTSVCAIDVKAMLKIPATTRSSTASG